MTGGAGYIGSALSHKLVAGGHTVISLDIRRQMPIQGVDPVTIDVLDTAAVRGVMELAQVDAVVHCAALISVRESFGRSNEYYNTNVAGTLSVLEAARLYGGLKAFVFTSSAAVYGGVGNSPVSEDAPLSPASPYGRTKMISETSVKDNSEDCGFAHAVLRLFNVAGSWNGIRDSVCSGHVLTSISRSIRCGTPMEIFGTDWPTPDGTCVRDYVHIHDVVSAISMVVEDAVRGRSHGTLNIGSGRGSSVLEMVRAAEKITGKDVSMVVRPRRGGDTAYLVASNARVKRELGWEPQHSTVDEIISSEFVHREPWPHLRSIRSSCSVPTILSVPRERSIRSHRR